MHPRWLLWNDETVLRLARHIYEQQKFEELPILGDALEEAGCADEAVLSHCHHSDGHVRGCGVVDLVLGQSRARSKRSSSEPRTE
jgi:hypothetical protein